MFLLMLRQSFFRGRRKKMLATCTIMLAASLITALMTISIDVGDKMSRELKSYGANLNLVPKSENLPLEIGGVDYNPLKGEVFLEEQDLGKAKEIFWHNNIAGYAPFLKVPTRLAGHGNASVPLIGTYFSRTVKLAGNEDFRTGVREINPYWQVQGTWPEDAAGGQVLAGSQLARKLGLKVGDRITLRYALVPTPPESVTVTGILTTGGAEESALVGPLALAQRISQHLGKVQSASVSALTVPEDRLSRKARRGPDSLDSLEYDRWYCTAYVSSIAHQLEEAIPSAAARPIWQVAASEGTVVNKIQLLMVVVTIAAFIASGLGISSLMVTTIMERSREIGLMKALGAADWEVYLLFLSESALVGLVGGLLGCAAGGLLAQLIGLTIFGSTVAFHPIVIPVNVVISILIALAGSLVPSRLITRLFPAEVLHGRK